MTRDKLYNITRDTDPKFFVENEDQVCQCNRQCIRRVSLEDSVSQGTYSLELEKNHDLWGGACLLFPCMRFVPLDTGSGKKVWRYMKIDHACHRKPDTA